MAQPAATPGPSCQSEFRVARDARRISGSCYVGDQYDPYDFTTYTWDFQLPQEPIIFIHGSMGSQIKCGTDELWPNIPPLPRLLDMRLAEDGIAPAPGACQNASVGDILQEVPLKQIYKPTVDFLNALEHGNVFFFNWDWRKDPRQSLAALDSKIDSIRASHHDSKVVIMAHSYGGLLARLYVDNAGRADKVARVLTVGTPAWGAPNALFPLYAGIKNPDLDPMNFILIPHSSLKELAKNLPGIYFLYPSASYGSWLRVAPAISLLNPQGLLSYVAQLGGNAILLGQALSVHATTLDSPYVAGTSGPRFEVIVGTGEVTATSIEILSGGRIGVFYGDGDGTVPSKSAARGALDNSNPNHAHIHYACGVDHVDLPGDRQITDAIGDYLKYGDDIKPMRGACSISGTEWLPYDVAALPATTGGGLAPSGPAGSAMSIEDAVLQGVVNYFDLPNQKIAVTNGDFAPVALPAARFLEVTPISDEGKGQPTIYGPLVGQITISAGADGPAVMVDGEPAPLDGDVNCDRQVTALDALLLVLDAAGTPKSQPAACSTIGSGADPFGDIDCDHSVTAEDGLAVLRIAAGVSLTSLVRCESGGA